MGCMYGWVAYVDHDVPGCARASGGAPACAAASGHGVAGRVRGALASFPAVAVAGHGVAVGAPASAAATAAAAAAASNPGGTA